VLKTSFSRLIIEEFLHFGKVRRLQSLTHNLIGNAWKFSSNVGEPRMEFGRMELTGKLTCFVRDNGVGFDMVYADKFV